MGRKRNSRFLAIMILLVIMVTSGCSSKTYAANAINPFENSKISSVLITKGGSQKELTDTDLITKIIANLDMVTVKKLSPKEEGKILDNGNALKRDTTVIIQLFNKGESQPQSFAILLSENVLVEPDVKSMQSSKRTISYVNVDDEATRNSVREIYSLVTAIQM